MKFRFTLVILIGVILSSCVGVSSKGIFGTGVSIAFPQKAFLVLEFPLLLIQELSVHKWMTRLCKKI